MSIDRIVKDFQQLFGDNGVQVTNRGSNSLIQIPLDGETHNVESTFQRARELAKDNGQSIPEFSVVQQEQTNGQRHSYLQFFIQKKDAESNNTSAAKDELCTAPTTATIALQTSSATTESFVPSVIDSPVRRRRNIRSVRETSRNGPEGFAGPKSNSTIHYERPGYISDERSESDDSEYEGDNAECSRKDAELSVRQKASEKSEVNQCAVACISAMLSMLFLVFIVFCAYALGIIPF